MFKYISNWLICAYLLMLTGCSPVATTIDNSFLIKPSTIVNIEDVVIEEPVTGITNINKTKPVKFKRYEPYLNKWMQLEEGLQYAEFETPIISSLGDSRIKVIKADPAYFNLKLLAVSELRKPLMSGPEWLDKYNLKAVINASMFSKNYRSSVSYMKNFGHFNNRKHKKKYGSYIAFNPDKKYQKQISPFTVLDNDQPNFKKEQVKYQTVVQNMRMINGNRDNLWNQSPKKWSISALAEDSDGNILFLFSRSPFSIHDFNENILNLPLNVKSTAYLEGGPVCFLGLSSDALAFNETGSFESGLRENNSNRKFQKVPNVLGLVRRENTTKLAQATKLKRINNTDKL